MKISFCLAISSGFFLPMARRNKVGATQGITGQHLRDKHDLLLINDNTVGIFQDRLELRKIVGNILFSVFTQDKVIDHPRA